MSKTMYAVVILLGAQSAHGDVLFFLDEAEFQAALQQAGKVLEGFEDFPWLAPPNSVIGTVGSVDVNTSVPGWIKPGVLIDNLTFQPNFGGADSSEVSPSPFMALFTMDFLDLPANGLVSSHFVSALDIISGAPNPANHTAMGMTINSIMGGPTVRVDVYDENNVLIGNMAAAPAGMDGAFLGILATGDDTLGRVNLYDPSIGAEGMFNISVWVSVPCLWDLNDDESVGVPDLLILLAFWGPCPPVCLGDFDGDDDVGVSDLLVLLANWGPCP